MKINKINQNWALIIKLSISIGLLFYIFQKIDVSSFFNKLNDITYLLPLLLIIPFLQIFLNVVIQYYLFLVFDIQISWLKTYKHNFISSLFLLIIPGFFAPDFYLAYHYGKTYGKYSKVVSGLVINRFLGFLIFTCFFFVALVFLQEPILKKVEWNWNNLSWGWVFLSGVFLGLILIALKRIFPSYLKRVKENFVMIRKDLVTGHKKMYRLVGLKIVRYTIGIGIRVFLAYSIGIDLTLLYIVGIVIIVNFLVSLPISFSGIGVREGGYVGLLMLFGVKEEVALTLSFLDFSLIIITALIGFLLYAFNVNRKNLVFTYFNK